LIPSLLSVADPGNFLSGVNVGEKNLYKI